MTTVAEVDVKINAKLDSFLASSAKAQKVIDDLDKRLNKLSNKTIKPTIQTKVGSTKDLALLERRLKFLDGKKFTTTVNTKVGSTAALAKLEARLRNLGNKNVKANLSSSTALVPNISGVLAGVGGALAIKEVQEYADAWTSANNKLKAASEITGTQTRSLGDLNKMANETRSSFEGTVDLYAKLIRVSGSLAATEADVAKATQTVTKAFKAGGATTMEQISGITQLGQALGSGLLQGDELRSIRENAPLIAKAIADEFETTIGGLKKLGEEGKLTSDRVFKAILNGSKTIDAAFSSTSMTIADGFTRVKNALIEYIGTADQSNGVTKTVVKALTALADNFEETADVVLKFAAVIAAAFIGRAIGGMIASLGLAIGQVTKFIAAIRAAQTAAMAGNAFAALGAAAGPIGAVLGVAAAAAIYFGSSALDSADNSEKLTEEMKKLGILADSLAPKLDDVGKSIKNMTAYDTRRKLQEINDELERLRGRSLKGFLGLAGDEERTLGDVVSRLKEIASVRRRRVNKEDSKIAEQFLQLIKDAESGQYALDDIEKRLNAIADISISGTFDGLINSLRILLPQMKSLRDYSNVVFQPQRPTYSNFVTEGTTAERDRREQEAWVNEQLALEMRSEKEKELAKITEGLLKDAKEAGQSLSEAAAKAAAVKIYENKVQTQNYSGALSGFVDKTIAAESGGLANAKNPLSTATGLGQFIESTWLNLFRKYFPDKADGMTRDAILALRTDANYSKQLIEAYAKENADILQKAGVSVNEAALHLSHFLGPQGAINVLKAAPGTPVSSVLGASAIKANPTILGGGKTVDDVIAYAQKRAGMDTAGTRKIESAEDFQSLLDNMDKQNTALMTETQLRAQLNPLVNDYGYSAARTQMAQELLTAAQKSGIEAGEELKDVDQLLKGEFDELSPAAKDQAEKMLLIADSAGKAQVASNKLAESQQDLKQALEDTKQLGKDVLGGFITDLRDGKSAAEAFANALQRIADKLLDVGLDAVFGLGSFSNKGGIFSGLFGGGISSAVGGGAISFDGGGYTGTGSRSGGIDGKGGFAAILHPNETVIDHTKGITVPKAQLNPNVSSRVGPSSVTVDLNVQTDSSSIVEIADTRIKGATPTIVRAASNEANKITKRNMGGYIADTQARQM